MSVSVATKATWICTLKCVGKCLPTAILALLLCLQTTVFPQSPFPPGTKVERFEYDGLRLLFKRQGLRTATKSFRFRLAMKRPREAVLVVLGDTKPLNSIGSRIYSFYKRGGAILVANDQTDHKFLFDFRTFLNSNKASFNPSESLARFQDCPVVLEFDSGHRLFHDVTSIATNRPGFLSFRDEDSQSYSRAWLPPNDQGYSESFVAVRQYGRNRGRLLVVADHSVFTNQMLVHGSNLVFADNVVKWLCEGESRRRLIFVRDGEVMPEFSFGNVAPPISTEQLLDAMNEILPRARPNLLDSSFREFTNNAIGSMQDNDVFNYALRNRARLRPDLFRRAFLVVVTAILASILVVKMMSTQSVIKVVTPRLSVKRRDHGPTARLLIRDFFVSENLTDRPPGSLPIAISQSWWTRRTLQRRIRRLWRLASASGANRTTARQLESLRNQLRQLDELRQTGQLKIQWQ